MTGGQLLRLVLSEEGTSEEKGLTRTSSPLHVHSADCRVNNVASDSTYTFVPAIIFDW